VTPLRITGRLLIAASLLALGACGADEATPTAASTTAVSVAPSSPAATTAAPSATAAGGTTGGKNDKKLCQNVQQAGDDMRQQLVDTLQSGAEPTPAVFRKILNDLDTKVTALAAAGGDSAVAAALKTFGAEAAKAAQDADPASAASNPTFEKAGADITAACKPSGVLVNF
jgi:hypothetical protein